jgi:inner membrane protein
MPSPVGHALGGLTAAWLAGGRQARGWLPRAILFAVVAILPDIDLLWRGHHQATHSFFAVGIVGAVTFLFFDRGGRKVTVPVMAAYASHILLDLLGADSTRPIGVMVLWPFSREYFISPWTPFPAISRRYWLRGFLEHNLRAVRFELAVLGPLAAGLWWITRASGASRQVHRI